MKANTLVIWFKNGTQACYEQVEDLDADLDIDFLTFDYFDKITQMKMAAVFKMDNIAGFSTT